MTKSRKNETGDQFKTMAPIEAFPIKLRWEIAEALEKLSTILRERPESVDVVERSLENLLITIRRAKG